MEEEIQLASPAPPKRQRRRANKRQRIHLVETLRANLDIARATELGLLGNPKVLEFWIKLTAELNSMGKKCARTVIEWPRVWTLWCMKLRTKCRKISSSLHALDGPTTDEHLSEIDIKILDIISRTDGHSDWESLKQSQTAETQEKQIPHSSSSPSEFTHLFTFTQTEEKQDKMASSAKTRKRLRTSLEYSTPSQGLKVECRVCLQYVCCENQCCDMFGPWNQNPEATIASYFTKITNIQISPSDSHTKYICFKCLGILQNCVIFIEKAHQSETMLRKRYELPINDSSKSLWPKPIQVDKCLSNDNKIEIEVKQEAMSEDEVPVIETNNEELKMDIKVEPEEYTSYENSPQTADTISLTPVLEDENTNNSDTNRYGDEDYLEEHIKEEPLSDNENELTLDLPLDCMLCTKTFHSVSGLKAHVIAQHSYLTIARKTQVRSAIYTCITCRRSFFTRTDLIVHETCHAQYACYMCNSKFDSFVALTKHRKRCRHNGNHASRLKTLEDVQRPSPDPHQTKTADSTNTEQEIQKIHSVNTEDSINKVPEQQEMRDPKAADLNTELESKIMKSVNSADPTNKVPELQKLLESQAPHTLKTADPTNTEPDSQGVHHPKAEDLTNTESQPLNHTNTAHSIHTESKSKKIDEAKTADSIESQKIHNVKAADSIADSKTKSLKIADSINTESNQSIKPKEQIAGWILDERLSDAIVETIDDNSSQDSNSPESNNPETKENSNSEVNNVNNSNSVLDRSNSETNNANSKTTNPDQDLDTLKPMDNSHKEISTESKKDLDLNSPAPATFSDLSQKQNPNRISTSPKLVSSSAEVAPNFITVVFNSDHTVVLNSDHVSVTENIVSDRSNLAFDSSNVVSVSGNSVSDSNLISDTGDIGNSVIDSSNLTSDSGNSVFDSSNIVADTGNSVFDSSNVASDSGNSVIDNSNLISDSGNSVFDSSTLVDSDNSVIDSSNVVSDSDNSVSKNIDLESDNRESVVEVNNTTKSLIECSNTSLEVSEHSIENTKVAESDSMEIHLAIHSLEKKSLDNLNAVKIDEEIIETPKSNEDKVLQ